MTIITPQGAVKIPLEIEAQGGAAIDAYVTEQLAQQQQS